MFSAFTTHATLTRQLVIREISARYRGSVMGVLWSLFTPILMLGIYTFVFNYVFKARWPMVSEEGEVLNFAMVLFLGLIIHGLVADTVTRSPRLILDNVNLVKKVVFPLESLAWVMILNALFNFMISLALLLIFVYWELGHIPLTALWLPLVLLPYVVILMGLSWILACLGVYLQDLQQISGTAATLLLFLSPVFYSITILPENVQPFIYLNPITLIVESARAVLLYGNPPDFRALGIYAVIAIAFFTLGYALFQKARKGFADVV
ncbi:MAG: ABC transporter permease [Pseudomonadales bacterium]|nr:ABC transporter permease [Pseudomonadales bacterium]MBO6563363.1 ABC transporter permease [Pseudomonadales bacterium]MBO6596225.1 ABC transporter permease [Pseudomonadales bacterium]MBO6657238.1 ABC transporter permease [Pseudomonadales bacterium]MBO6702836.1 ABC transporter permease [Pseudomonadales bacterium]